MSSNIFSNIYVSGGLYAQTGLNVTGNILVASGLSTSIVQGSNVAVFSNASGFSNVFIINSLGQVGIGSTAVQPIPTGSGSNNPILFVYGTSTTSHGVLVQTTGGTAGTANVCINTDGTNPNIELRSSTNSGAPYIDFASSSSGVDYDARMILVNNGNTFSISSNIIQFTPTTGVGIGIASPLAPFHVFSNVGASFSNTTSVNYQQTSVIGFNYGGGVGAGTRDSFRIISSVVNRDNGAGPYYDYGAQADLVFQRKTNNLYSGGATDQTYTEVMRLGGATGYVGIGTTSPTTALQVNGGQISVPSYISSVGSPYTTGQQFYFAFNGNLTDSQSGATTTPTGNAGGFVDNAAIRFNGNYYFTFPNSLVTSVVSMTVAFWFCPLSASGSQTIFSFANGSNSVNMNIDGNGSGGLQAYIATPNQWTVSALNTGALNLGTWYHIAYTCSTTAATCYVNGVQVSQQTGTYTNGSFGMGTVYVGTNGDGQGRRANCFLDELRVYNTALTGAQVATLYSSVTFTPNGMSGGSVLTNCVGVGVTTPVNSIDTSGAVAIGSYAGANQAPAGGLICPGNVGIGTNSPGSTLQVSGTGATFTCGGVVGTSNVLQFGSPTTYYGTSSAYLSTRFAILTSGLPVTNDAFNGNGGVYASAQGIRIQGQDLTWAGGAIRSYGSSIEVDGGGSKNASISYGQIRFYTANNQRLTIDESGNVGIGNTTPYLPLLVNSTGNGGIGQGGIGLTVKQGDVDLTIGNLGGGFTIPYIQSFNNGSTTALGTSQYSITLNPFRGSVGIGTWAPRQTIDLPQTNFYPSSQNSLISRINWSYCYPNNTNITYSPTFNPSSTARIYFPNPATTASSSATGIYLNLGTITPTPASSGFTVIARVMFTTAATNTWERIFDWGNGQNNDNILLARYSTTTLLSFGMQNGGTGMPNLNGGTIVQNVVTNVAIKFDPSASGGTAYLYQDGVLLASQTASASTYTNNNARTNCYIGRSNWGVDSLFTGYIYEFQAHNAVLTDAEIFAVMNSWNGTAAVSITTGGDVNCTGSYRIGNVLQPKIPSTLQRHFTLQKFGSIGTKTVQPETMVMFLSTSKILEETHLVFRKQIQQNIVMGVQQITQVQSHIWHQVLNQ
jgi:Concanavalin A-like lectin/glucanases superfamily